MPSIYLHIIGLLCLSCTAFTCQKNKAIDQKTKVEPRLEFGNGGGFTGAVSKIIIHKNGEVYRNGLNDTSFVKLGILTVRNTTQMFDNYSKFGLDKLQLNEPGNRYYYIIFKNGDKEHKIQWGYKELDNKIPAQYFKLAMDLVKNLK
jgi:hypothetical protein